MPEAALALDPAGNRPSRGGCRILVADDERHIVRLIQVNLERYGYEVIAAFDGKEALETVDSERPNLIILDEMMPLMDGFEVLQNLKKDPNTRVIPVILLSSKDSDAEVFRGWQ